MCVIVIKPYNKEIPNEDLLKKCWKGNDDGAGMMYQDGREIVIKKGFMNFDELMLALWEVEEKVKDKNLVIHFRAASCVKVAPEFTHPFPVSNKLQDLKELVCRTKMAVAHNGIFSRMGNREMSDTQEFVLKKLAPLGRRLYERKVLELIAEIIGYSKLVFMFPSKDGRGRVEMLGEFKEKDGYFFSNLSWMYSSYRSVYYYTWKKDEKENDRNSHWRLSDDYFRYW